MDKTLWKNEEKKFKPVNKQAAMIVRRASYWHMPPEEPEPVGPLLTSVQRAKLQYEEESRLRKERIAERLKQSDQRLLDRRKRKSEADKKWAALHPCKHNPPDLKWKKKQMAKLERMVEKAKAQRFGIATTKTGSRALRIR